MGRMGGSGLAGCDRRPIHGRSSAVDEIDVPLTIVFVVVALRSREGKSLVFVVAWRSKMYSEWQRVTVFNCVLMHWRTLVAHWRCACCGETGVRRMICIKPKYCWRWRGHFVVLNSGCLIPPASIWSLAFSFSPQWGKNSKTVAFVLRFDWPLCGLRPVVASILIVACRSDHHSLDVVEVVASDGLIGVRVNDIWRKLLLPCCCCSCSCCSLVVAGGWGTGAVWRGETGNRQGRSCGVVVRRGPSRTWKGKKFQIKFTV